MKYKISYLALILIIGFYTNSCIEPFEIKTLSFENALVVEATITDEFKKHEIKLSRTFKLEEFTPLSESNAIVKIEDESQNTYDFEEIEPGHYRSLTAFKAQQNVSYKLLILTSNGRSYSSQPTKLTKRAEIDEVYALKSVDNDGISIFVDSFNPNGDARYYRYDYEETYKIIVPKWSAYDFEIISDVPPYQVEIVPRTQEEKTCYNTIYSDGIIQTESNSFNEDRITKFLVRKIQKDDFILSHRYSILVKQYVQSLEAYTFYNILNELSGSGSLFSQNQPGFISGNLFSNEDYSEKVLGFFEVSSVSSKRLFFNPKDIIFSGPLFIGNCNIRAPKLDDGLGNSPLIEAIKAGTVKYYLDNHESNFTEPIEPGGPYVVVYSECGDCTSLGSNEVPDFWEE